MKIKELIEELSKFNPETEVLGMCTDPTNYTYKLPKRRSSFYASIYYEKLNNKPSIGQTRGKYEYGELQNAPIYMASLGLKYRIGRK
jgi:hypothetical protein